MSTMTSIRTAIPAGPWTVEDLDDFPEGDTTRSELIDGALLVVEVSSPSTQAVDRTLKRQVLQEAGVPSYWLVEPDELVLTVLELVDGAYEQVARVRGDSAFAATQPFPVEVAPGRLIR